MSIETLGSFFLASVLLALSPGPDNLFVLAQSVVQGARAGVVITLGLCSGLIVHTAAVAVGVAVLLQTTPWAFTALKVFGALYLLYLAWGAFQTASPGAAGAGRQSLPLWRLYQRGIIMNVTNPKVTIFFLAFLPQFVEPDAGEATPQILLLGLLFGLAAMLVFSGIALAAGRLADGFMRSVRGMRWLNRIAGIVFVGLSLKLLMSGL